MLLDRSGGPATRLDRITAARTDRAARQTHGAARRERHGREGRKVIAVGRLGAPAVWRAARVVWRVPLG